MDELKDLLEPVIVTALIGLIGWAVARIEVLVKATKTDVDDKILDAVKRALKEEKEGNG